MTTSSLARILTLHGIEVWFGYAVTQYTINGIPGESFTDIKKLGTKNKVYAWLGY